MARGSFAACKAIKSGRRNLKTLHVSPLLYTPSSVSVCEIQLNLLVDVEVSTCATCDDYVDRVINRGDT